MLQASLFSILLLSSQGHVRAPRSCRRLSRNGGWWHLVWTSYSDRRFKQTLRVSRGTFQYILCQIRADILKQVVTEEPVSPECRLAICLYRLGRGDYLSTKYSVPLRDVNVMLWRQESQGYHDAQDRKQ